MILSRGLRDMVRSGEAGLVSRYSSYFYLDSSLYVEKEQRKGACLNVWKENILIVIEYVQMLGREEMAVRCGIVQLIHECCL